MRNRLDCYVIGKELSVDKNQEFCIPVLILSLTGYTALGKLLSISRSQCHLLISMISKVPSSCNYIHVSPD